MIPFILIGAGLWLLREDKKIEKEINKEKEEKPLPLGTENDNTIIVPNENTELTPVAEIETAPEIPQPDEEGEKPDETLS